MGQSQSLYAYIKDELLNRIRGEKYKVGEKIPTELELCKEFNVSRTTVRLALAQLTTEGYLTRTQGRGTFVANKKVKQILSSTTESYVDQVQAQGKEAKITLVDLSVIKADNDIKENLNVKLNDPIQRVERVRQANSEFTQYEVSYIPWKLAPGITKEHTETSLYVSLKKYFSIYVAKTIEKIELALADENVSYHLNCEENLPCFYIETIAKDTYGNNIEYSKSYFRGDKTSFTIERMYE